MIRGLSEILFHMEIPKWSYIKLHKYLLTLLFEAIVEWTWSHV